MGTDKPTAEAILEKLSAVADARMRSMMGDYVVYVDEKVIGQINDRLVFIKVTPFGETFAPDLEKRSAYQGSKPAFVIPKDMLDNTGWLSDFIAGTVSQLSKPKH